MVFKGNLAPAGTLLVTYGLRISLERKISRYLTFEISMFKKNIFMDSDPLHIAVVPFQCSPL